MCNHVANRYSCECGVTRFLHAHHKDTKTMWQQIRIHIKRQIGALPYQLDPRRPSLRIKYHDQHRNGGGGVNQQLTKKAPNIEVTSNDWCRNILPTQKLFYALTSFERDTRSGTGGSKWFKPSPFFPHISSVLNYVIKILPVPEDLDKSYKCMV